MANRSRLAAYAEQIADIFGRADRAAPFRAYCEGLLLPGDRKSIGPMAERLGPKRVLRTHQSLHHFVANSAWADEALLRRVRELVLPRLAPRGAMLAWVVDVTAFRKSGVHSVGVARQPCGRAGRPEACQIVVSLSLANAQVSLPLSFRLFLPEIWAADAARRQAAGIPDEVVFETETQIALDQIRAARAEGVAEGVVLAEALHGGDIGFRAALTQMGLTYIVGVPSMARFWPQATAAGFGARVPASLQRWKSGKEPLQVGLLARSLPPEAWREVSWREEAGKPLSSRFAILQGRASRDVEGQRPSEIESLIVEWPILEREPTEYWLSTLSAQTPLEIIVETARLRRRSRRDLDMLMRELGLGHYEGRGWRGFHHHLALCVAAYGFLIWDPRGGSEDDDRARSTETPPAAS